MSDRTHLTGRVIAPRLRGMLRSRHKVSSMLSHGSDYQQASELLLKVTAGDDEEAAAWERWLRIRAERLVSRYWKQITAVAEALRERKTLSGRDVRQIMLESHPAALKLGSR